MDVWGLEILLPREKRSREIMLVALPPIWHTPAIGLLFLSHARTQNDEKDQ
jgi:hypothetical protein